MSDLDITVDGKLDFYLPGRKKKRSEMVFRFTPTTEQRKSIAGLKPGDTVKVTINGVVDEL